MRYARMQPGDARSKNPRDALNMPLDTWKAKRNKRRREIGLPGVTTSSLHGHERALRDPLPTGDPYVATHSEGETADPKPDPIALLTGLYYQARTTDDLEELCERARTVGFKTLEDRCLEDLATRRARGTWIATYHRPLPGGAYSNLRNA